MSRRRTERFRGEEGKFNGTVVLFVIIFVVLGVGLIDGGSILFAKLQLHDLAETAASDAATEYKKGHSESAAFEVAQRVVAERDKTVTLDEDSFEANENGETISLTLTKNASVLFIDKIPPLESFVHMTATVDTPPTII